LRRKLRKITLFLLVFVFIFAYNVVEPRAVSLEVSAKSAVLIEACSGRVLYQKNAFEKMPMASTTKIMTAIVALEHGNVSDIVQVSQNASGTEGSSIWLSAGETMSLSDMLFGLMLASGNDAAIAIAEHISGSVGEFTKLMNAKAQEIGAYNTNFVNPNGLPAQGHYTTAYDLALISAYAMQNEYFSQIVKTQYKTLPWDGHKWDRVVKNKNKILWSYEGGNGIKTGYTKDAGRCLSAGAQRENMQLVAVVLGASDMFGDCMSMMDHGFENYNNHLLLGSGEYVGEVNVEQGKEESFSVHTEKDIYYPLTDEEYTKIEKQIFLEDTLKAPVAKGQTVGYIDIWLGTNKLRTAELKAPFSIGENSYKFNLDRLLDFWINTRLLDM